MVAHKDRKIPQMNGKRIESFKLAIAVKMTTYFPNNIKINAPDIPGNIIAVPDRIPEAKILKKLCSEFSWPKKSRHKPKPKPVVIVK